MKAKWLTASSDDPDFLSEIDAARREIGKVEVTGTDRPAGLISPMNMAHEVRNFAPSAAGRGKTPKPNLKQLKSLPMNLRALGFV